MSGSVTGLWKGKTTTTTRSWGQCQLPPRTLGVVSRRKNEEVCLGIFRVLQVFTHAEPSLALRASLPHSPPKCRPVLQKFYAPRPGQLLRRNKVGLSAQ